MLVSHDEARSFELLQQDDRKGLVAALAIRPGALVAVGEGGVKLIQLAPRSGAATTTIP